MGLQDIGAWLLQSQHHHSVLRLYGMARYDLSLKERDIISITSVSGWATDLKTVPLHMIQKRVLRTGDGSHPYAIEHANEAAIAAKVEETRDVEHFWGWNDELLTADDKKYVTIHNKTE